MFFPSFSLFALEHGFSVILIMLPCNLKIILLSFKVLLFFNNLCNCFNYYKVYFNKKKSKHRGLGEKTGISLEMDEL